MKNPLHKKLVHVPPVLNQHRAMPAVYFDRSVDQNPGATPGGAGGGITPPLYLQQADATNVFVVFGQVAGFTPTGVATNIDVSGTDGTWSIYLHATLNTAGAVTAVEILSGTTGVPANDNNNAYALIGEVDVAAGLITALRPSLMFSQGFAACGRVVTDGGVTTAGTYYFFVS